MGGDFVPCDFRLTLIQRSSIGSIPSRKPIIHSAHFRDDAFFLGRRPRVRMDFAEEDRRMRFVTAFAKQAGDGAMRNV